MFSSADELLNDLSFMETIQLTKVHQGSRRLQSKPPQRTRTGQRINSHFIGYQFKVTQSDSLGCRGRSRGPCNEIHAASLLSKASADILDVFILLIHSHISFAIASLHVRSVFFMDGKQVNRNANKYSVKLCHYCPSRRILKDRNLSFLRSVG